MNVIIWTYANAKAKFIEKYVYLRLIFDDKFNNSNVKKDELA